MRGQYSSWYGSCSQRLQFSDPYRSISKTMVMMMGEFEYNTVFKQNSNTDDVPYRYLAFPMWALFVILVPVLMTNLLVSNHQLRPLGGKRRDEHTHTLV